MKTRNCPNSIFAPHNQADALENAASIVTFLRVAIVKMMESGDAYSEEISGGVWCCLDHAANLIRYSQEETRRASEAVDALGLSGGPQE